MNGTSTRGRPSGTSRRLVQAAQQGDRTAQEELFRRYEPLVRRVVWKLRLPLGCERADIAQEARIGLLAAIRNWRPERGPFPAFADRCVNNQALLAVQAAARHKHQLLSRALSLDTELGGHGNPASSFLPERLLDIMAAANARTDPEKQVLVREQLTSVLDALPALTRSERQALGGVLAGESYQRLGPIIGGTPKAASQAVYRARRKLAAAQRRAA